MFAVTKFVRSAGACALALAFSTYALAQQKPYLPFKVYVGKVESFDVTKGVNTIRVNDGFVVTGTMPVSPNNTYRIKHGQALALLYANRLPKSEARVDFGNLQTETWGKVIRKADGQEVQMDNYPGVSMRWELSYVFTGKTDEYQISRMFKSKFKPALPAAELEKTDGVYLIHSPEVAPAQKVPAFAKDVNKVAGKVLTAHYLVSRIDADAYFTVDVDFTDVVATPLPGSAPKAAQAADPATGVMGQKQRDDRAAAMQKAQESKEEAQKPEQDERAAHKEAKAVDRAEAAAERARKRAEAAADRRLKAQ